MGQNPFLENTEDAWKTLSSYGFHLDSLALLLPALQLELIYATQKPTSHSFDDVPLHLRQFIAWLHRHWEGCEEVRLRAQLFALLRLSLALQEKSLQTLNEHGARSFFPQGALTSMALAEYWQAVFGLNPIQSEFVLSSLQKKHPPKHATLLMLSDNEFEFQSTVRDHFQSLAETALQNTEIFVGVTPRAFAAVTPNGKKHLFLPSKSTTHPLEAAKWIHEVAHLADFEVAVAQARDWHSLTTVAKETVAVREEANFVYKLSKTSPRFSKLLKHWNFENFHLQLELLNSEMETFQDSSTAKKMSTHQLFGLPMQAAVYAAVAAKLTYGP